jgi:hypothetical protein
MDPVALLDMERRTGFSHSEVDEFAQRMDMVNKNRTPLSSFY